MDFSRAEADIEVSRLAAQVLTAGNRDSRADQDNDLDTFLWKELSQAGLLSLALPAELGGDELGMLGIAALLTEVGRHAARIPALATFALGVLPVMRSPDPV